MSDPNPLPDQESVAEAVPRKPGPRLLQPIWIIPIVAVVIGAWLAMKNYLDQGPTIELQFKSAEGIEPGKTRIKHKAVDIGIVRSVRLSGDFKTAIVKAEMDRSASRGFLVEDTRFWVVRPRFAGGQVSGLATLFAGAYIGADPGTSNNEKREFQGLENPPIITTDQPGRQYTLHADDLGTLDVNSPVYFRGVLAGRVVSADLPSDGRSVQIGVFVQTPYDKLVTTDTRFWNASGVDISLDANGVKVQAQSLVPILFGGVSFEAPPDAPATGVAPPNTEYRLWDNRADAMRTHEAVIENYLLTFAQTVRGLNIGAPVDFRGIAVGQVRRIDLVFDRERTDFAQVVEIEFYPERLRSRWRAPDSRWNTVPSTERLKRMVEHGLRAQLRSANLLTGQMYVALDFFPKAPKVKFDPAKKPAEIPTITGGLSELQESITNIIAKVEKIPFEQIAADLRRALQSLDAGVKHADKLMATLNDDVAPALRSALEDARKTLRSVDQAVSADSPLQGDLRETLSEVTRAAERLKEVADYLDRHPEALIRGKRGDDKK
jgi:paraquat-inducible protein B